MPCTDVTEFLVLDLDDRERVMNYELTKQTCGGAVAGRGLIREWVKGRTVDEILALSPEIVLGGSDNRDTVYEYLCLKHLFSIQAALRAYLGAGLPNGPCPADLLSLEHAPGRITLRARLKLGLITNAIKACGLCGDVAGAD